MSANRARRRSNGEGVNILAQRLAKTAAAPAPSPWQNKADSWSASFSGRSKFPTPPSVNTRPTLTADDRRDSIRQPETPGAGRSPDQPASGGSKAAANNALAASMANLGVDENTPKTAPSSLLGRRRHRVSPTGTSPTSPKKSGEKKQLTVQVTSSGHREAPRVRVPSPGAMDASDAKASSSASRKLKSPALQFSASPVQSPKASLVSPSGLTSSNSKEEYKTLREKLRRLETRALRAEAATREAERAHLLLTRGRLAAERLVEQRDVHLETLLTASKTLEARLNVSEERCSAWQAKAQSLNRLKAGTQLTPDQKTDCFLKAGFLSHYWRLAYNLGIAPNVSWRECSVWVPRAPRGGDLCLANVVKAVADAWSVGNVTPGFCKPSLERNDEGAQLDDKSNAKNKTIEIPSDLYSESAPKPKRENGWTPCTAFDLLEVETAMRVLVSERIEESVLVALADRRRARTERTVSSGGNGALGSRINSAPSPYGPHNSPTPFSSPNAVHHISHESDTPDDASTWITLSDAEVKEVEYRRLWVCWVWSRARGRAHATKFAGLAEPKCEKWFARASGNQSVFAAAREAMEVEEALREVRVLGVEHALVMAANTGRGGVA